MGIWQKNFSTVLFLWKNFKNYLKYKHTSCFVLDKGNVRQGTQREFFCFISWGFFSPNIPIFYIFLQIQHEVNIFLRFWTCLLHQAPLLACHCSILSSCVWKSPIRTQPKLMFQGQTRYCFSQSYILTYLRQKNHSTWISVSAALGFCSQTFLHNHKKLVRVLHCVLAQKRQLSISVMQST